MSKRSFTSKRLIKTLCLSAVLLGASLSYGYSMVVLVPENLGNLFQQSQVMEQQLATLNAKYEALHSQCQTKQPTLNNKGKQQ